VEVDEKKLKKGQDVNDNPRNLSRAERLARVKKNERQHKMNEKRVVMGVAGGSSGTRSPGGKGVKKRKY